eukprot:9476904-Pyramimonas_sp.AAC.1
MSNPGVTQTLETAKILSNETSSLRLGYLGSQLGLEGVGKQRQAAVKERRSMNDGGGEGIVKAASDERRWW